MRIFLGVTFVAVVISTLAECQPFDHYWQVVPDPGGQCRQGYANLITMGVADMMTDIVLIVFPIPVIVQSAMPLKRKISLVLLFSMSAALIAITGARVPSVIKKQGRQQFRTVFASGEILAAATISNAIILGSFLRDRGVKKAKWKFGSTTDSMERSSTRRPTLQHFGSDEDLIRDMGGYRIKPELRAEQSQSSPRKAEAANIDMLKNGHTGTRPFSGKDWQFPQSPMSPGFTNTTRASEESDLKGSVAPDAPLPSPQELRIVPPKRNVSFFDVGGLLEDGTAMSSVRSSTIAETASPTSGASVHDFASSPRKGSRAFISDIGGLFTRSPRPSQTEESHEMTARPGSSKPSSSPPTGVMGPILSRNETHISLQDAGGLLSNGTSSKRSSLKPPPTNSHRASISGNGLARQNTLQSLQDVGGLLSPSSPSSPSKASKS